MRGIARSFALLGGGLLALAGCATAPEWGEWRAHPTHYASGDHGAFSARNRDGRPGRITERDRVLAGGESWWGELVPPAPPMDVSGRWVGRWEGTGVFNSARASHVEARFSQRGAAGEGRLMLADVIGVEGVPWGLREAGSWGAPIVFQVSGSRVFVSREGVNGLGVSAVFTREGEALVGRFPRSVARITLTRAR